MENEKTFQYTYSARDNQEVLDIQEKYLPRQESKVEEQKWLDNLVQIYGVMEALIVGVAGNDHDGAFYRRI